MPNRCLLEMDCRIKPEKRREFRLNIGASLQSGRAVVYEDLNEPGHILIVQEWPGVEQVRVYLSSEDFVLMIGGFQVLGVLLDCRVIELSGEPTSMALPTFITRNLEGWRLLET